MNIAGSADHGALTRGHHYTHNSHRHASRSDRNAGRVLRFLFALACLASLAGYAALLPGCAIFESTHNAEPLTPIAKWYRAQSTFNATLNTLSTLREDGQINDETYRIIDPLVDEAQRTLDEMKRAADAGRDLEFDDHLRTFERILGIMKRYATQPGDTALVAPVHQLLAPINRSMEASFNHESGDTSTHLRRVTDRSGDDECHQGSGARKQRDRRGHPAGTHPWTRGARALEGARTHFHTRALTECRNGQHAARDGWRGLIATTPQRNFLKDAAQDVSPCRVATAQAKHCESSSTGERTDRGWAVSRSPDHDRSR